MRKASRWTGKLISFPFYSFLFLSCIVSFSLILSYIYTIPHSHSTFYFFLFVFKFSLPSVIFLHLLFFLFNFCVTPFSFSVFCFVLFILASHSFKLTSINHFLNSDNNNIRLFSSIITSNIGHLFALNKLFLGKQHFYFSMLSN